MITPAQNFLKQQKIAYKTYEYKCTVDHDFGKFAASALNIEEDKVFKMIDEELERLEQTLNELKEDNENKKKEIKKKEIILEHIENLKQDNV